MKNDQVFTMFFILGTRRNLCNIHVRRYWKEKVLTNKEFWGDIVQTTVSEISAQPQEQMVYDSGDICNLCQLSLNDPLKRSKSKMKCPQCDAKLHKPCFVKDPSEMGLVRCLNCNP